MTIVDTTTGRVEGRREAGVERFLGIPYAAPPVGELRFRAPRPPTPWPGVRPASDPGPVAPQLPPASELSGGATGPHAEECLTVNVWTPAADGARRPVLVWVHGGAFVGGSGSMPLYRGAALAARGDVVVVTCNYRLGVLGFLAHPDLADEEAGGAGGNWGLLDQVAALQWVRDNVAAFGGDPADVTVFGESAGGMSVCDLLAMPAAAGLVHRAVAQSGPPMAATRERAEAVTEEVLYDLGVERAGDLRGVAVDALLAAQGHLLARHATGQLPLVPVVDGTSLPTDPGTAFAAGDTAPVPLLIGTNRDEAKFFLVADPANRDPDEATVVRRIGRRLEAWGVPLEAAEVVSAYRAARAGRGDPTDPRELWSAIETDLVFRVRSARAAAAHAASGRPTWSYLFTWESPAMGGALGACHALEVPFVLGTLDAPGMDRFAGTGPRAAELRDRMMDAWVAFARCGDPSHPGVGAWPCYDADRRSTLVFGPDVEVVDAPFEEERQLWEVVP